MRGTIVDVVLILVAGAIGLFLRKKLPKQYEESVLFALGLTAIPIGIGLFLETGNPIIVLFSTTLGFLWGCLWRLQDRLDLVGDWLKKHSGFLKRLVPHQEGDDFTTAFVTATVVSLVGPLAIMGPINEGMTGDCSMLYTKCVFDFFATVLFAAGLGEGVLFSAIPIFLFQGAITFAASWMGKLLTPSMIKEMTAAGGVLIMAMGINVAGIRKIKMGNFLPAILIAPVVTYLWSIAANLWPGIFR